MISELRKSTNAILFERVTSPLYGTLIVSWIIWNWKIIYLTFFIDSRKIENNKIDYIIDNFSNLEHIIYYPILSTIIIITVIPFLSNGAFWLNLKFKKWRVDEKNKIEDKQLLSIEQSIDIRKELREKEKDFQELLSKKDLEIKLLEKEIESYNPSKTKNNAEKVSATDKVSLGTLNNDYSKFKANDSAFKYFFDSAKHIRKKSSFPKDTPENIIEYYLINDIVGKSGDIYYLSNKGNSFYKLFFNENFDIN